MTIDLHPFPFAGTGPEDHGRRRFAASTAAALCAVSFAYAAALIVANGWLGVAKAWLGWPAFTLLNLAAMLAALAGALLAGREIARSTSGWRSPNSAVFVASVLLWIAFILGLLVALVLLALGAGDDSDEESGHRVRPRRGQHPRHRSGRRDRRRRQSGHSPSWARRHW